MATELESLYTIRTQVLERLVEITASKKPTYSVDGQSVSWESYFATLSTQLETIERHIQRAEGPVWNTTMGLP